MAEAAGAVFEVLCLLGGSLFRGLSSPALGFDNGIMGYLIFTCMHVFVYVRMYVCVYVCRNLCMYERISDGACMFFCKHVCVCVYTQNNSWKDCH